jgi:hypothetical protein
VGSYIFIVGGHNAVEYVSDLLMYNLGKIFIFQLCVFYYYSYPLRLKFPYSMNPDSFSVNHHQIADTMPAFWQTVVYSFLEALTAKSPLTMCTFWILQLVHISRRLLASQWRQPDPVKSRFYCQVVQYADDGILYDYADKTCPALLLFSFIFSGNNHYALGIHAIK